MCTDCSSPDPSIGDAQVLDDVCALFEEDSHAGIHVGQGVLLALSLSEGTEPVGRLTRIPTVETKTIWSYLICQN